MFCHVAPGVNTIAKPGGAQVDYKNYLKYILKRLLKGGGG